MKKKPKKGLRGKEQQTNVSKNIRFDPTYWCAYLPNKLKTLSLLIAWLHPV